MCDAGVVGNVLGNLATGGLYGAGKGLASGRPLEAASALGPFGSVAQPTVGTGPALAGNLAGVGAGLGAAGGIGGGGFGIEPSAGAAPELGTTGAGQGARLLGPEGLPILTDSSGVAAIPVGETGLQSGPGFTAADIAAGAGRGAASGLTNPALFGQPQSVTGAYGPTADPSTSLQATRLGFTPGIGSPGAAGSPAGGGFGIDPMTGLFGLQATQLGMGVGKQLMAPKPIDPLAAFAAQSAQAQAARGGMSSADRETGIANLSARGQSISPQFAARARQGDQSALDQLKAMLGQGSF